MLIHVTRNGQRFGPYPLETVHSYLREGRLMLDDLGWYEGASGWKPLAQICEISVEPPPPPPPMVASLMSPSDVPASDPRSIANVGSSVSRELEHGLWQEEAGRLRIDHAVMYPWQQSDWIAKLWWVSLLNFVPVLGLIAMRGWRVDIVRRVGRSHDSLPEARDLGKFLADGTIFWVMSLLYSLPLVLLLAIFGPSTIRTVLEIGWWLLQKIFTGNSTVTLSVILADLTFQALASLVLPAVYYLLSWPIYRAGVIRYAMTGQVGVFFEIPTNARIVYTHLPDFMLLFFFDVFMVKLGLSLISLVLLAVGIGAVLVPAISLPLYYWTTGHLYGQVAARTGLYREAGVTQWASPRLPSAPVA